MTTTTVRSVFAYLDSPRNRPRWHTAFGITREIRGQHLNDVLAALDVLYEEGRIETMRQLPSGRTLYRVTP
jgi:hypothetical protein